MMFIINIINIDIHIDYICWYINNINNIYYYVLINEFPSLFSLCFDWISHFPSVFLQRYVLLATQTNKQMNLGKSFGDSIISKIWLFAFQNSGAIRTWYLLNAIMAKNILLEPGLGRHDRAGTFSCCWWECKMVGLLRERSWQFLRKASIAYSF